MGNCCSDNVPRQYSMENEVNEKEFDPVEDHISISTYGEGEGRVRLRGHSRFVSMYSQQGRKEVNQDAMTVWEDFNGEKDKIFCGVFDGHGPFGHVVARYVRKHLPSKLSAAIKMSQQKVFMHRDAYAAEGENHQALSLASWENTFLKSFNEMDQAIARDINTNSFYSGSTAVTVIKQGDQLIIGNLGDSRAVLCTRGARDQLIPLQLTVDLKPDIPSEAERIRSCEGRVFAEEEEPDVYRMWMPDEDCPGLAMSRAFGDFCLKDYGLISSPDVFYRRLTEQDEFVVLATDGVWDALTNDEVIEIVASAPRRSRAARLLVKRAVQAWDYKFPGAKVDDCAAICLFLKDQPGLTKSGENRRQRKHYHESARNEDTRSLDSLVSKDEWVALKGLSRANSISKLTGLIRDVNRRHPSQFLEGVEVH
ncbi:probable protein phosphatase 2C 65 [Prosopis cineraria]|uniref:probable protein phosphatase 2C 65 n=1 Tax=Prosopis cineraria TaxID=364024 RepID=UPI0024109A2C|nr:probable protein phosphatase 2C 65 [Prosopis cineraria]